MTDRTDFNYEFGPFRLDTAERLLLRDQVRVALTPKAFDTLLILVQSRGRLVRKDDLIKQVWPDTVVEEANLARNIWAIRKALGDTHGQAAYIETIPKIGYRFMGPVTETTVEAGLQRSPNPGERAAAEPGPEPAPDAPVPQPAVRRRVWALFAAALVLAGAMAIALTIMWNEKAPTSAPEPTFLTDGTHDDAAAYWTNGGRIYFSRAVTATRSETWTMDANGSNPHRANTAITNLLTGRWSPDAGIFIFFKEDVAGKAFLAYADGGHEVGLPFVPGNLDWSADGSRVVYEAKTPSGSSELFLYELETGKSVALTPGMASADPSFSSDGWQIAFTSWRDGNSEIYVMDADGTHVRRLTDHPAFDNYPVFSPDGTQIAFQSNREDEHVEVYLQNLNDRTPPRRLTRTSGGAGLRPKCWSPDGTRMLVFADRNGQDQIQIIAVDPFPAQLVLGDAAADLSYPRLSADGKRLLHEARLDDRSLELRVTELDTKRTRTLFRTEPDYPLRFHLEPAWSSDNSLIAFVARAGGNSEIFVINADGSGLRNVTNNPLVDLSPVFAPGGAEIVFERDSYGQAQLYRMDLDGHHQRRVTAAPGWEMSPAFSPDGRYLAFAGDRQSRGLDIFLLDLNKPGGETLLVSRRFQDSGPAFSPDGMRLAFVATSDGNPEIYVMNVDGTGLLRVTRSQAEEAAPQFSRDGGRILFSANRAGRFALYGVQVR